MYQFIFYFFALVFNDLHNLTKIILKKFAESKYSRIFVSTKQTDMTTIAETKENNAKVKALKKVAQTKWVGNTIHDNMDKCLRAINLDSSNSGHYNPVATRINGLTGWFMINQDGSIFCEARVIKEDEKQYKIEYMTNAAWNEFENDYCNFLDEN